MKTPQIDNLADTAPPSDRFTQTVQAVKEQAGKVKPKSYSQPQADIDYISKKAAQLAKIEGKPVSASKALAALLDEHRAFQKGVK